jgi:hypothetical protein
MNVDEVVMFAKVLFPAGCERFKKEFFLEKYENFETEYSFIFKLVMTRKNCNLSIFLLEFLKSIPT